MFLGEPAPSQGDINFRFFGIPIRIHPFFWLVTILLGVNNRGVPEILSWIAAVLLSIMIHELGHALVIRAYGFRTWIVLYGMGGMTCHNPAERYNSKANTPLGQIIISFSGPLAGFLLAGAIVLLLFLSGHRYEVIFRPLTDGFWSSVMPFWYNPSRQAMFVNNIFFISVLWGLVNLMPIYPLDGGKIVRELLQYMNPRDGIRQSLMLSILTAAAFAFFAIMRLHSLYVGIFFGFLAYESFIALQAYSNGNRW